MISVFVLALTMVTRAQEVASCEVKFETMAVPVRVKIEGKSESGCKGKVEIRGDSVKGKFTLDAASLLTGIERRDEHLRDKYLESSKFKVIELTLNSAEDATQQIAGSASNESIFVGELVMHGEKKEIKGKYQIKNKKVSASFSVAMKDFAMEQPSFMGVTVRDDIKLMVTFKIP